MPCYNPTDNVHTVAELSRPAHTGFGSSQCRFDTQTVAPRERAKLLKTAWDEGGGHDAIAVHTKVN